MGKKKRKAGADKSGLYITGLLVIALIVFGAAFAQVYGVRALSAAVALLLLTALTAQIGAGD